MQSIKIVFKSISLSKQEKEKIIEFLTPFQSVDFHYYPIFDEKEHMNSIAGDINIWIVDKYDENQSDKYHCVIRFTTMDELLEEFQTLIEEIVEIFAIEEDSTISIEQSLLSNTDTKRYNLDRRGKGELDVNYIPGVVEEDSEARERRLRSKTTGVIGLNPYKDLFK